MEFVFQYPTAPLVRKHGPKGYVDPKSFKPWLRDEFDFRCVYCLWRERWSASGDAAFSVEHLESRVVAPDLVCEYDNLIYACCRCNSIKTDTRAGLDPCKIGFGLHVEVDSSGTIQALTPEGSELVKTCRLDEPLLTESRRRIILLIDQLASSEDDRAADLLEHYLGLPSNLPCLAKLRPPAGNSRSHGIASSYYERRGMP